MEPAKSRGTTTMAAKLPSRALPQSLEAAKLSIITVSTGLSEGEYEPLVPIDDGGPGRLTEQPARRGRAPCMVNIDLPINSSKTKRRTVAFSAAFLSASQCRSV